MPTVFGVVGVVLGAELQAELVPGPASAAAERRVGYVRARDVGVERVRTRIQSSTSRARRVILYRNGRRGDLGDGRDRVAGDADADRPLLRQPAADPERPGRPVRAGRDRDLRVLARPDRLGAGRADRDPRDEPAGVCSASAVSNGCVRVHNRDLRRLFAVALSGTPVTIHP